MVIAGAPVEWAADVVTADNRSGSAAIVPTSSVIMASDGCSGVDGPPKSPDSWNGDSAWTRCSARTRSVSSSAGTEDLSVQSGEEAGERLVAMPREDLPDAVVSANDQMAIGVLRRDPGPGSRCLTR